jgi:hypothetical protein
MTGQVRKRRGKRKSAAAARNDTKAQDDDEPRQQQQQEEEEEETAWQTFKNHPLVTVLPIVLIPYILYISCLFLQLQRPDIVETATLGLLQLRPAVTRTDMRQVLIVGTMSSGTVQVAHDLTHQLPLEVGHQVVDADWSFCRDGTVSWFHGIRFLPPLLEFKEVVQKWSLLCGSNYTENMGFHPSMYTSSSCSSRNQKWSKCWSNACLEILQQEWGCAWKESGCITPFHSTLLQVRNPVHTISSLVTKFCVGGISNGTIHSSSFLPYASALFSFHNFTRDSCMEAMGTFVVEYNTAMLKARDAGLIADFYRIEETSACQVAHLAGLDREETTVYPPNYKRVARICNNDLEYANRVMESTRHLVNRGQVSLTWEDLRGGSVHGSRSRRKSDASSSLEKSVKTLFSQLGYDPSTVEKDSGEF